MEKGRVLVVTHSKLLELLLISDPKANKALPSSKRIKVLNAEIFAYNFEYLI